MTYMASLERQGNVILQMPNSATPHKLVVMLLVHNGGCIGQKVAQYSLRCGPATRSQAYGNNTYNCFVKC